MPPRDPRSPDALPDASAAGWSGHPADLDPADATWPLNNGAHAQDAAPGPGAPPSRYLVGAMVGEGGMGRVYAARDLRLDREVALKEALPGTEARLAREARVTAWLDHPNIVPVHDVGHTAEGRAFYAMRLVRGRTLAAALAASPDDLAARLRHVRTLLAVADAVAFAHARGVVHRDLKPANILVGEFGETQVMDWGVARVLGRAEPVETGRVGAGGAPAPLTAVPGPEASDPAALTAAGGVVGTPRYMSPEQANGAPVDTRADVWSLGAILYEVLAGGPPYDGTWRETLDAARAGVVPPLRGRAPDAPPELVAIAERALRPAPDERYPTARAFAADLEAWLDGRRVGAHAYTQRELVERLVRAWRVPLGVAAVAAVLLAVGGAVATARVVAERDRARAAERATAGALVDAEESLADALVARALTALEGGDQPAAELAAARALTLRESAEARGVLAAFALGERPRLLARTSAPSCEVARLSDDPRAIACDDAAGVGLWDSERATWRWRAEGPEAVGMDGTRVYLTESGLELPVPRVLDVTTGRPLSARFAALRGLVLGAARAGGTLLAAPGEGVRLLTPGLDADTEIARCPEGVRAQVSRSDARWQVVACNDGTLLVWGDGALRTTAPTLPTPTALALLGDTVVVGGAGGAIQVLHLPTGALRAAGDSGLGPVRAIEPWPGGAGVAVLGDLGVGWWDTEASALHLRLARRDLRALRVFDGSVWVLGGALERWSAPTTPPARVLRSPNGVGGVTIDAAGERLLAYGGGGDVRVWSVADGRLLGDHRVQEGVTKAAAFGPDGGIVAVAASAPGLAWHTPSKAGASEALAPPHFRDRRYRRVFALRSGWTALLEYGDTLWFARWGAAAPSSSARLGGGTLDLALAPDATWGAALDERGAIYRIEGEPPAARPLFTDPGAGALAVAADGRVVTLTQDEVRVFDAAGAPLAAIGAAGLRDVAIRPDGRRIAAGTAGGVTYVWDLSEGGATPAALTLRAVLHGHTARVQGVAFSPNGQWLATGSWDGTTRRWGLDVLDAAPDALQARLEAAWGRTLEDLEGPRESPEKRGRIPAAEEERQGP